MAPPLHRRARSRGHRDGTSATGPAGHPFGVLSALEIDLLIAIEGRAPDVVRATARRLRMSPDAVWRWVYRLKKRNLLRTINIVDRSRFRGAVESVARIRVNWSHPAADDLEVALRDDPAVTQAALMFGPFDYTAFATHADHHEAAAWSRWLQSQPCVSWCQVDRMQTRFKRFTFAAALLNPVDMQ